jgi:ATP-dependent DNA helicase RecQ
MPPHLARETVSARRSAQLKQVLFSLLGGYGLNERDDAEIDVADFADTLGMELAQTRRALSSLAEAGIVRYQPARRTRGVLMKDEEPATRLRIRPEELARRAALEQRKLREMISFCYTENCYRSFILDYFGDRSHDDTCGKCGNCLLQSSTRGQNAPPLDAPRALDRFIMKHVPAGLDLEEELATQSRTRKKREAAEAPAFEEEGDDGAGSIAVTEPRELSEDERLTVRKILACAARMGGRFGKGMLASALRGSRSAKLSQAGLDQLSTYGILSGMTQDEILLYVDALVAAGCLHVTGGAYPTISLTLTGGEVMRERATVQLRLPPLYTGPAYAPTSARASARAAAPAAPKLNTVEETYALYEQGLTVEEICAQRGLTEITVEGHLADCILRGRPFEVARFVSAEDRAQIERAAAQLGTERLKPLREALPRHITYRMIRFVVADLQRAAGLGEEE